MSLFSLLYSKTFVLACNEWCAWSECDTDCGPGDQVRVRTCEPPVAPDTETEQQRECPLEEQTPCDKSGTCAWTPWCAWSPCDGSPCDSTSERARARICECEDPDCDKAQKEAECPGESVETEPCLQVYTS